MLYNSVTQNLRGKHALRHQIDLIVILDNMNHIINKILKIVKHVLEKMILKFPSDNLPKFKRLSK